ncbi:MAG: M3 family oligoendopeptidase [Verrucomicrobiae bacterium]|nr:M3 family oligoendopeptidase [Verrucomicrobiae bacterium]
MTAAPLFAELIPFKPRSFLPRSLDLGNWTEIEPLFDKLETSSASLQSATDLEQWLLQYSELSAALSEESSRRYISMTCHTDDPECEKAYLHFLEKIEPRAKPRHFTLQQRVALCPQGTQLPEERFYIYLRSVRNQVSLYREKNVPLQTAESKLSQQYQKISGAMTVTHDGQEKTLIQMGRLLENRDRSLREEAWSLMARRRMRDADELDGLFEELLGLRTQLAQNADLPDYRAYCFRNYERFDYTPEDCLRFHESIERHFVPLARLLQEKRRRALSLEKLRPWDMDVDPENAPPLEPFTEISQLIGRTQEIFDGLDPELGEGFRLMNQKGLLDLANRKGKAPGGYQASLSEARLPFIFMNAVGQQRDVDTLLHEAGHAFHALAVRNEDLSFVRGAPMEFCEVASMSMELLAAPHLEKFYSPADAARARTRHLEGIIRFFPWMATIDAFQHWIYTHPGHSRSDRHAAWLDVHARFGGVEDWSGWEEYRRRLWHRQLHIFEYPFYYVEYGIAQLGALQVWRRARENPQAALTDYKTALAWGGKKSLPDLFAAAGIRFDFSEDTIAPLVSLLRKELDL